MKNFSIIKGHARNIRFGAWFAVLSIGLTLLAGLSRASDERSCKGAVHERPFKGWFHGFAEAPTPTDDPNVVEIVVPLKGRATHLGRYDMRLVHQLNVNTLAFTGYTEWTAANGDRLYTTFVGQAYPTDDPAWVTFDVTHTITGGTGRFKRATGSFEGVGGRFNLVTGEDLGGYLGTISY
jgi:hypothetical protein